ncbi:TRAP transporter substrate-binding protein [Ahrensia sp. R2A130]|uniref:TRAP transporter substrate-binding protein n=1 Tax=Ahrensia sp. R2A130 TaxID=744979 RepID=UPI0001E094CA|nr:TRAP transporter substrate-binding protein [Ahrensia sp. R2A130]EFL88177.1 trap dicarboxylate transporter, periplasmic ligand binding subunit dctp [Ahrensia sp. R2A130]
MFDRTRRRLITAAAALALAATTGTAFAAESWRMATKMPVDSPEGKIFAKFAELTGKYSDGELTIKVFPNEQLGKEDAVLEQLQANVIQIYGEGFGFLKKWVPETSWTNAAFMFEDREHWARFMNSDLAKSWFKQVEDKAGITLLGDPTLILRGPYRVMVTKEPVKSLDDVAGRKLRMHPNQLAIATWSHLGAEVITMPWTEVYSGIDKGIVGAVNSPVALVESMRFNEVAPNIARTDEYHQSIGFMVNKAALDGLDDKQRDALMKAYNEAGAMSTSAMQDVTDASLKRMQENGVNYVELDTAPFVERMKSFYADLQAKGELPEGFVEAVEATKAK